MDTENKIKVKNFLYYYKVHIIIAVIVIAVIAVSITQCVTKIHPDITISIITKDYISEEDETKLEEAFASSGIITDINGDGNINVDIDYILTAATADKDIDMAVDQQIMAKLSVTDSVLFLLDKSVLKKLDETDVFSDVSSLSEDIEDERKYLLGSSVISINAEGNSYLEGLGIKTDGMYIALRAKRSNDNKKHTEEIFKISKNLFEHILNY